MKLSKFKKIFMFSETIGLGLIARVGKSESIEAEALLTLIFSWDLLTARRTQDGSLHIKI